MISPASLMVHLTAGAPDAALLRLTADLAARLKATQVIGIGACQPLQIYGSPDMYVPPDLINSDREQIDKELKATEESFRCALEGKVTSLEWRSTVVTYASIADYVAEEMRAADLLITAAEAAEGGSLGDRTRHADLPDVVLRAGRPVLVVGAGIDAVDLRSVLVTWKDTREARRAVEDALPLLMLADRVTIVESADEDDLAGARMRTEDVADWLARHGIAASARAVGSATDEARQLRSLAEELDAGLLVGGAYGHSRLREWVLGGITRELLLRPARCALVSH